MCALIVLERCVDRIAKRIIRYLDSWTEVDRDIARDRTG